MIENTVPVSDEQNLQLLGASSVPTAQNVEEWALEEDAPNPSPLERMLGMLWIIEEITYCEWGRFNRLTRPQKWACLAFVVVSVLWRQFTPFNWWSLALQVAMTSIVLLLLLYTGSKREFH